MKVLALDSSGLVASVAVVEDDNLLGEYTINYKKTHSQTLLPMIDEIVRMSGKHFDPAVVKLFIQNFDKFKAVHNKIPDKQIY